MRDRGELPEHVSVRSSRAARELGVGLVYWPALGPVVQCSEVCAVLELEPQSLWEKVAGRGGHEYRLNERGFDEFVQLPQPKLMHGVGQPVGGTIDDPVEYRSLLRHMADRLDPAWISEHLSFNRVSRGAEVREAGFLLPPAQTMASARLAARNIARYSAALGRPFAFETGVNYLRPRGGEMDDAEFFTAVAKRAGCGILLDLHNLWCNERNGRQRVDDALAGMPLDRVWELHLAGGMPFRGYWLDAHSGGVPAPVRALAARWIPRMPSLRAVIFEILPEHLSAIGLDGVYRELERLRELWSLRPPRRVACRATTRLEPDAVTPEDIAETRSAELGLYGQITEGEEADQSDRDPGCLLLRELIEEFRSASLARALRYTVTALVAGLGPSEARALLDQYFREAPPDAFPAIEADRFAGFLRGHRGTVDAVPYLAEVLAFESALLAATLRGEATELEWSVDPDAVFAELDRGRLPGSLPKVRSRMNVTVG